MPDQITPDKRVKEIAKDIGGAVAILVGVFFGTDVTAASETLANLIALAVGAAGFLYTSVRALYRDIQDKFDDSPEPTV